MHVALSIVSNVEMISLEDTCWLCTKTAPFYINILCIPGSWYLRGSRSLSITNTREWLQTAQTRPWSRGKLSVQLLTRAKVILRMGSGQIWPHGLLLSLRIDMSTSGNSESSSEAQSLALTYTCWSVILYFLVSETGRQQKLLGGLLESDNQPTGGMALSSLAVVTALVLLMWQLDYPELSRVPLRPVNRCVKSSVTKCQHVVSILRREKAVPPGIWENWLK